MPENTEALNVEAELIEHNVDINDARAIANELFQGDFQGEIQQAQQRRDGEALSDVAKRMATVVLARLDAPGEIELHEQVFQMVFELLNVDYSGSAADNL